jgi:hypothetical protein
MSYQEERWLHACDSLFREDKTLLSIAIITKIPRYETRQTTMIRQENEIPIVAFKESQGKFHILDS